MSESEAARVLRIIAKYAAAAADEIDGGQDEGEPEVSDWEAAKAQQAARHSRLIKK